MDKLHDRYKNPKPLEDLEITFFAPAAYAETTLAPVPAIDNLPDWWKDRPLYQVHDDFSKLNVSSNMGAD
jgi:hypothetical protein